MDDTQLPGNDDMNNDNGAGGAAPTPEPAADDTPEEAGEDTANA